MKGKIPIQAEVRTYRLPVDLNDFSIILSNILLGKESKDARITSNKTTYALKLPNGTNKTESNTIAMVPVHQERKTNAVLALCGISFFLVNFSQHVIRLKPNCIGSNSMEGNAINDFIKSEKGKK